MTPRRTAVLLALVLLALTLVGVRGSGPLFDHDAAAQPTSPRSPQATAPAGHAVLALGDSVPSGAACRCDPFPTTYGALLSKRTGVPVTVDNRAVGGLDTAGLLAQLRDPAVEDAARRSDVFLVTIGANDFGDHHDDVVNGQCGPGDTDCVSDELATLRRHLTAALAEIQGLRGGRPTTILVTGYWNVFQDGEVARRAFGDAGLQAARRLTARANAVIAAVSDAVDARYVDISQPFEESSADVTSLLAPDGDHPDAAGHRLIARTLVSAGLPRIR